MIDGKGEGGLRRLSEQSCIVATLFIVIFYKYVLLDKSEYFIRNARKFRVWFFTAMDIDYFCERFSQSLIKCFPQLANITLPPITLMSLPYPISWPWNVLIIENYISILRQRQKKIVSQYPRIYIHFWSSYLPLYFFNLCTFSD